MRTAIVFVALFSSSVLAAGPCDVESDNCRAVINGSACYNKYMAGATAANMLSCLAGTEGSATPKEKMCSCTGCLGPAMINVITKTKMCN